MWSIRRQRIKHQLHQIQILLSHGTFSLQSAHDPSLSWSLITWPAVQELNHLFSVRLLSQPVEIRDRFGTTYISQNLVTLRWTKDATSQESNFLVVDTLGSQYKALKHNHRLVCVILGGNMQDVSGIINNLLTDDDRICPVLFGELTKKQKKEEKVAVQAKNDEVESQIAEEERIDDGERARSRAERKKRATTQP